MIRVGIIGYGNLGRGVECAVNKASDMQLMAVFTRRDPGSVNILSENVEVASVDTVTDWVGKIDVMVLCGGSATDLEAQTPHFAEYFNVVDSFDTHPKILQHYGDVNEAALEHNTLAVISAGWDPGLFSLNRVYADAVLPAGNTYTFWGRGVSQGHSDAVRRIDGVLDARQYTIPVEAVLEAVRNGENPEFTTRQKHTRYCYVVAADGYDREEIREKIVTMPDYFADYDTTVEFITAEEMQKNHSGLAHGGFVIHSGSTGPEDENTNIIEYRLKLDSNPEFTGSVLTAVARAVYRMSQEGQTGCRTMLDIPPAYLSTKTTEEFLKNML